jgi:formate dehydrogenase subunit gamma
MSVCAESIEEITRPDHEESEQILRFRNSERHLHWALAVPFVVCYLTALVLVFVYNPHPVRPYRSVFSWIHRISGVCLAVLPPLTILRHWGDFKLHLSNIRRAWVWSWDDVKWLMLVGPATLNKRIKQPDQGKFNAGEKINFMAQMSTYPVYVVTGLLIWLSAVPYLPWLVHFFTAAFVATPLVLGHIFMATVNPDTRVGLSGMITGFVNRHWAEHHYRHWYDELYGQSEDVEQPAAEVELRRANVVPFRAPAGALASPAFLRSRGAARAPEDAPRAPEPKQPRVDGLPATDAPHGSGWPGSTTSEAASPSNAGNGQLDCGVTSAARSPWTAEEDDADVVRCGSRTERAYLEYREYLKDERHRNPGPRGSDADPGVRPRNTSGLAAE